MLELPLHWTADQAMAVFEVLDELNALVWRSYEVQIQQAMRRDQASIPANIDDGNVPF